MIETLRVTFRIFIPKGQRAKWVALVGLALLVAAAETLTAFLIFRVLSFATDPTETADTVDLALGIDVTLVPLLFIAAGAFVFRGVLSVFSVYAQNRVVQNAGAAVSARVHRQYLQAPYRFHLTRSSSESVRTVLWSVDQATQSALNPIISAIAQTFITVMLLALLISLAPLLSIAAIVVLAGGLGLVMTIVQPKLGRLGKLSEDTIQALLASVRDSFDSVRDIKAYRAEGYFDLRFKRHRRVIANLRINKNVLDQIPGVTLEFIVVLGLLILIGVAQSDDSFAEFIPVLGAFGYATLRIVPSLNKIVASANRLKFGHQAVLNVQNDLRSAIPEPTPPPVAQASGPLFTDSIMLSQLSFTYPDADRRALDNVDLEIRRGEMLAIAGGSGSGKSTLADVILGLLEPESGSIAIDGSEVLPPGWHRRIGIVSQSVVLLDASVRENVAFGAGDAADDARVLRALERARLGEWLARLPSGLDTMVGESGKLVSGGERQRVAIARSLYRQPDLLILDEATSALDGATEAGLIETLTELSSELTTIIVSHRIAPIQAADRVALMEDGRITAVGPFASLVSDTAEFQDLVGL
jgi:ABC-type multidrug transport system fused ATPase/permease subunit